jgi:hypothetical protein
VEGCGAEMSSSDFVVDQPRSHVVQNHRNVMSEAVVFVTSFTDPGAPQWRH